MAKLTKVLPWVLAACMGQALAQDQETLTARQKTIKEEGTGRADGNTRRRIPVPKGAAATLPSNGAILVADDSIVPIPGTADTQSEARIIALTLNGAVFEEDFITDANLLEPQNAILSPDETEIWVANRLLSDTNILDEVRRYDLSGNPQGTLIANDNRIQTIGGMTVSHMGTLLIAVSAPDDAILEYDDSGNFIQTFITPPASVVNLQDVLLLRDPITREPLEYLVTGLESDSVGRFDLDGNFLSTLSVSLPRQVSQALDGNILVASLGSGDPLDNDGALVEFDPSSGSQVGTYSPFSGNTIINSQFRGVLDIPLGPYNSFLLSSSGEAFESSTNEVSLRGGVRVISRANVLVESILPFSGEDSLSLTYNELLLPTQLEFMKTASRTNALAGGLLSYTLEITAVNDLTDTVITDTIPDEVTYLSNDCGQAAPVGDIFTWVIGAMSASQTLTCTIETVVDRPLAVDTQFTNQALASSTQTVFPVASSVTVTIIGDILIFGDGYED